MSETSAGNGTPKHLWVVGGIALLWNAMGAMDFVMTMSRNAEYLEHFTAEQLSYFFGFPVWVVVAWSVGVWCSVLGTICLLLRSDLAIPFYLASLIGMCFTTLYNYVLTDGMEFLGGVGGLIFSMVIFGAGIALFLYSRAMRDRGVLT